MRRTRTIFRGHRVPALVLLITIPALLSALVLARATRHHVAWWAPARPAPTAASLLEAVASREVAVAHALIWEGQSTDVRLPFEHRSLTGGRRVTVTPLLLAAALGDENMVLMLLTYGDQPADRLTSLAACVAYENGRESIGRAIEERYPGIDRSCPAWRPQVPLLQQVAP